MSREIKQLSERKISYDKKGSFIPFMSSYKNGAPAIQVKKYNEDGNDDGEDIITFNPELHGIPLNSTEFDIPSDKKKYLDAMLDAGILIMRDEGNRNEYQKFESPDNRTFYVAIINPDIVENQDGEYSNEDEDSVE
jgi:hypothetical protein